MELLLDRFSEKSVLEGKTEMSCQGCIEWLRQFGLTLQPQSDDGTNARYFYQNEHPPFRTKSFEKREIKGRKQLRRLWASVSRRAVIIQSHSDVSQWCCSLTHPRSAHFLGVIWSQGESRLKTHFDTIKYNLGAKRTEQDCVSDTRARLEFY